MYNIHHNKTWVYICGLLGTEVVHSKKGTVATCTCEDDSSEFLASRDHALHLDTTSSSSLL